MRVSIALMCWLLLAGISRIEAQQMHADSAFIRSIYTEALVNGKAYESLRELCKKIGNRISGSPQANQAVIWGERLMQEYGFDTVYLQKTDVPNWKRSKTEKLVVNEYNPDTRVKNPVSSFIPKITTLGGSVATDGELKGELVQVSSFDELKQLGKEKVAGKIVFFNMPMEPANIQTFKSYGSCVMQRVVGADEASALGAKGVIIRSVTLATDNHPHTGTVKYEGKVPKIPAVAVSTETANQLAGGFKKGYTYNISLELDCKWMPDTISYNVIGEIRGKVNPKRIIAVGGHLDSWDIGEGAHDDGAGCMHAFESVRLLKQLGYKPNNTLRVVFFMNEENGMRGAKNYASIAREKNEDHLAGIESDAGGLVPRGFSFEKEEHANAVKGWAELFKPYDVHVFEKGYSGADIGQIRDFTNGALVGFVPDSQRYFDYHHSEADVFENVNRRELELGCATISSLIYLIDKYGFKTTQH